MEGKAMAKKGAVTIYHNPKCTTSCNVLAMIEETGVKPMVVEYLKTGWTKPQLKALFAAAGVTPRQALRAWPMITPSPCARALPVMPSASKPASAKTQRAQRT